MSQYNLSSSSKRHREGINPKLIEISDLAIQLTLVDFGHGPHSGVRSAEEQHSLFMDKKSECDGYEKVSNHQSGNALDFYAYVVRASWKHEHLAMVACAFFQAASILGYKIKWGGLWKSIAPETVNGMTYGWDMPHIELIED